MSIKPCRGGSKGRPDGRHKESPKKVSILMKIIAEKLG